MQFDYAQGNPSHIRHDDAPAILDSPASVMDDLEARLHELSIVARTNTEPAEDL